MTPTDGNEDSAAVWEQLLDAGATPDGLTGEDLRARNVVGRLIFGKGLFWYVIIKEKKGL